MKKLQKLKLNSVSRLASDLNDRMQQMIRGGYGSGGHHILEKTVRQDGVKLKKMVLLLTGSFPVGCLVVSIIIL